LYSLQKISVSIIILFLPLSLPGAVPFHATAGAEEAGMGYACVMKPGFWSSFHNQALLSASGTLACAISYQSRFGIKELGTRSAAVIVPSGRAVAGAVYSQCGYPDFRRESAGLACGLKLSEKISAGVQAGYFSEKTYGEYEDHIFITCEAGIAIYPDETMIIGIHLFNPLPVMGIRNNIPSALRAGIGSYISRLLFAGVEAEMCTRNRLNLKGGFEYEAAGRLKLRGGFGTENSSFSFGLGYKMETVQLDISFSTHETLGITPSASMVFKIK
jgi:hypothetical protein